MPITQQQSLECQAPQYTPFGDICEQHADTVAKLWQLWQSSLRQPIYDKASLGVIESKIRANIAGMMTSPDDAWTYGLCTFKAGNAAEIFTMAQLAFRSYKAGRIRHVMERSAHNSALTQGLVSALVWLPADIAHPWLKKFIKSKNLHHKTVALKACRLRNESPSKYLSRFLEQKSYQGHLQLYIESLRIVGELKIHTMKPFLYEALEASESVRFWGLYSLILLGEHELAQELSPYIFQSNERQKKAINLVFRLLPTEAAWALIYELREYPQFKRRVIMATSILGDPSSIPWILEQMKSPHLARICGEAFYNITGINIESSDLCLDTPHASTNDTPQANTSQNLVELESDEHLPWPDAIKIEHYWQQTQQHSPVQEQRYFLGAPINKPRLTIILNNYRQRQRQSAALELALISPEYPLFNTRGVCTPER